MAQNRQTWCQCDFLLQNIEFYNTSIFGQTIFGQKTFGKGTVQKLDNLTKEYIDTKIIENNMIKSKDLDITKGFVNQGVEPRDPKLNKNYDLY